MPVHRQKKDTTWSAPMLADQRARKQAPCGPIAGGALPPVDGGAGLAEEFLPAASNGSSRPPLPPGLWAGFTPTPTLPGSTQEQTVPPLPDQQTFQQYLRELARGAIRVVLEAVIREELDALIGVGWGECSPKRKGYRNGHYRRDVATSTGRIEDLKVPRDREGHFHTQAFERYSRYEPHIAEGRDGDVRVRHKHPQSGGSCPNVAGSRSQCQCDQSPQPNTHATI